jgi:glucosamine 6-phosphate synthetase-like amidotransferase/phosphosugar isomerase protein
MCGIIGAFHTGENKEPVNEIVLSQFEDQQERGVKGFGIIKIDDKRSYKVERATEGYKFMWDIHRDPVRCMVVHHRTPTSSDNKMAQTHPLVIDNGSLKFKYLFIHNGIIYNEDEVKKAHEALGFVYTTVDKSGIVEKFNDSEVMGIEIARFIEKQIDVIASRGSAAFICLQIDKKTDKVVKLFFGRNTNPLHMAKTRNILLLSSTGKGDDIEPMFLYECHLDDKMKLSKRKLEFAPDPPTSSYPSWHSYTPANITPRNLPLADLGRKRTAARVWENGHWKDDEYDDGYLTDFGHQGFADDELDQEELVEIVEDCDEAVKTILGDFYDMLYDPTSAETIVEQDVSAVLDQIKFDLEDVVTKIKEKHMQLALAKETEKTVDKTPVAD